MRLATTLILSSSIALLTTGCFSDDEGPFELKGGEGGGSQSSASGQPSGGTQSGGTQSNGSGTASGGLGEVEPGGLLGGGLLGGAGELGGASKGDAKKQVLSCSNWATKGKTTGSEHGLVCDVTDVLEGVVDTCNVLDPEKLLDGDLKSFTSVEYTLGAVDSVLGGHVDVSTKLDETTAANEVVAVKLAFPAALVQAGISNGLTIETYLGDALQESVSVSQLLEVDLLGSVVTGFGEGEGFLGFENTKPYDRVVLRVDSALVDANLLTSQVRFYGLCTRGNIAAAD